MKPDKKKVERLITEIAEDFAKIRAALPLPTSPDGVYLQRQIEKYLKPASTATLEEIWRGRLQMSLERLHTFFADKANREKWKIGGDAFRQQGSFAHRAKLWAAFGYAKLGGNGLAGEQIVIQGKAWLLPDKILAGVMVHEATHFVLGTQDHAYDRSCWPGHGKLKSLAATLCFDNADNWRIFYQKMRAHFRKDRTKDPTEEQAEPAQPAAT